METLEYILNKYPSEGRSPHYIEGGRREHGLAGLFRDLGFTVGAEIGVERGIYSKSLLDIIPNLKLYCVDAWLNFPDYRYNYGEKTENYYEETKRRLSGYNAEIIRGLSTDVVKQFPDESLDFVFIDANHEFRHVVDDIDDWSRKVRMGGIVSGHDFRRMKAPEEVIHVKDVIPAWCFAKRIHNWWVFTGDRGPSWFWVKS